MVYNTGNAIGSTDPRDLSDNSENFDRAVNNAASATWTDRLGKIRTSLAGQIGYRGTGTDGAIEDYAAGQELSGYNVIIRYNSEFYRPSASATLPYTTTATTPDADPNLVSIGDANLRQDLANNTTSLGSDLVAKADTGETVTTALNQRVIYVGSVAELEGAAPASDGIRYSATRFRPGSDLGGGEFYWDSVQAKSGHNGIDIIDPGKAFPTDFEVSAQVDTWLTADGVGNGCFVRADVSEINATWAGLPLADPDSTYSLVAKIEELVFARKISAYFPAGTYDVGDRNFPFRDSAGTSLKDYGGVRIYGDGKQTVFSTTSDDGADVLQLNAVENITIDNLKVTATLNALMDSGCNGVSITNGGRNITLDIIAEDLPFVDAGSFMDGGKALTIQPAASTNQLSNIKARIRAKNVGYGFGMDIQNDALIGNPIEGIEVDLYCDTAYRGVVLGGAANTSTVGTNGLDWGVTVRATTVNCQQHYISSRAWGANVRIRAINTVTPLDGYLAGDTEVFVDSITGSKNEVAEITGSVESVDVLHRVGGTTNGGGVSGSSANCTLDLNVDFQTATTQFDIVNSGGNVIEDSVISLKNVTSVTFEDIVSEGNTLVIGGVIRSRDIRTYNSFSLLNDSGAKTFGIRPDGNLESVLTTTSALGAYVGKKAEYDAAGSFIGYRGIYG